MLSLAKRASCDDIPQKINKSKLSEYKVSFSPWELEDPTDYAGSKFIDFLDSKMKNPAHTKKNATFHETLSPIPDIESYTQMMSNPIQTSEQSPMLEQDRRSFSRRRLTEEAFSKGKDTSLSTNMNLYKRRAANEDLSTQNSTLTPKIFVNKKGSTGANWRSMHGREVTGKDSFEKGAPNSSRSYQERKELDLKRAMTGILSSIEKEVGDKNEVDEKGRVGQGEKKCLSANSSVQRYRAISRLGSRNGKNLVNEKSNADEENKTMISFWNRERLNSRPQLKTNDYEMVSAVSGDSKSTQQNVSEANGLKNKIREVVERQTMSGKFPINKAIVRNEANGGVNGRRVKDNRSPGNKMRKLKLSGNMNNEASRNSRTLEKESTGFRSSNAELSFPLFEDVLHNNYKTLSIPVYKDLSQITLPKSDVTSPSNQSGRMGGATKSSSSNAQGKVEEGGFEQYLDMVAENEGMASQKKSDIVNSIKLTNKIWNDHMGKYEDSHGPVAPREKLIPEEKVYSVRKIEKISRKKDLGRDNTCLTAILKLSRQEMIEKGEKKNGLSLTISPKAEHYKPVQSLFTVETAKDFFAKRLLKGKDNSKDFDSLNQTPSVLNDRTVSRIKNVPKTREEQEKERFSQTQVDFKGVFQRRNTEVVKSIRKTRVKKQV